MKLKFTLTRDGGDATDLLATVDAATTVGDLAAHLLRVDPVPARVPHHSSGTPTLRIGDVPLDPARTIGDSGLRSGARVRVVRSADTYPVAPPPARATLTMASGPSAGAEITLRGLTAIVGRDAACDVRLRDDEVSRRHARINLGTTVEIIDLGSANGIEVNGSPVSRAVLRSGDVIRLGSTELIVRLVATLGGTSDAAAEAFVRSPRVEPQHKGAELVAPEPPQRPQLPRLPIIPLVTPVITGGLLYLFTHSAMSLIFVAISPLMALGYAVEGILAGRSAYKKALAQHAADVKDLVQQAEAALLEEKAARQREHPSLNDCASAVQDAANLLWSRRPAETGFAELRLGLGRRPARLKIELPQARGQQRKLMGELERIADRFSIVDGVPVVAQLGEGGALGVAGPRARLLDAARGLVAQAVALHSPAELVLVAFANRQPAADWTWLTWLPHVTSAHNPMRQRTLASSIEDGTALVSALEDLLVQRQDKAAPALPAVLVLVEDDAPVERSRLVALAENGWPHGIHILWLAADVSRLPAACRTHVFLRDASGPATVGYAMTGETVESVAVEGLDAAGAEALARRLSPMADVGARIDDGSDLPRAVSLLTVSDGSPLVPAPGVVLERWLENRTVLTGPYAPDRPVKQAGTLRAVIGRSATGAHALDLRTDGPHALVGGTTGSGKSELLQSWILALAAAYSPQRLTLLLIDYKGGSAFAGVERLPHTVGLVTDLNPHEVRRAMVSLSAELRYRERLFAEHKAKDLVELEKKGVAEAPPSLVIVVDEFAALVTELPEFVDGVIDVAQRGRSLGVHLILATQRPAGVIKDNLRANTNLRLALRTADENDSMDVLGTPQAAFFESAVPGRAVSKTGPGRLVPFQTGYAGGWTTDEPPPPEILVEQLTFGPRQVWEVEATDDVPVDPGPTDIQRLVAAIGDARLQAHLPLPRKPWLPMLKRVYDLADPNDIRNTRRDDQIVFGVQDRPDVQAQPTVMFEPDRQGNLAVYGTGGSGKTTLLRTIAVAAGFTVRGGPCLVYGIDFGSRGLAMLESLPHVGSIVAGSEHDRIARLLTMLADTVAQRAERFAAVGAGTLTEFRAAPGGSPQEPRILLLLDGIAAFRTAYEAGDKAKLFDRFCAIAADGRPVGVHVLLTADRPGSLPSALASAVQSRVVLRMADANDYAVLNLPSDVLHPASPPGRGLVGDAEIQVAILGKNTDVGSQVAMLARFAADMVQAGVRPAPEIGRLPDEVRLDRLPASVEDQPVLGLSATSLRPQPFPADGAFLITGPPLSGRSEAMLAVATALRRWKPETQLHFFGPRRSVLAPEALWTRRAAGADDARAYAEELLAQLNSELPKEPFAVFLENVPDFQYGPAETALTELVKLCLAEGLMVVAESESTSVTGNMGLFGLLRSSRYGLALAPEPSDGERFRTPFPPRISRADFPFGRGLYVHAGTASSVQVGLVKGA